MGKFSDDGQWWWDGNAWIATAQVVVPQLPMTEIEKSGRLTVARGRVKKVGGLSAANTFNPLAAATGAAVLAILPQALRDYRLWKLEQMALATAYLLGPDEEMLAGEVHLVDAFPEDFAPPLAVAITTGHVLLFRFDSLEGQPRRIQLAGRVQDVVIELRSHIFGLNRTLLVSGGNGQWTIRAFPGVSRLDVVVEAWRKAAGAAPSM